MKRAQRGFSLIPAIFLIVVIAALAAFAIRIGTAQQSANDLSLLEERTQAAAQAGMEWGEARALMPSCVSVLPPFVVNGIRVQVSCASISTAPPGSPSNYNSYQITADAWNGVFGSPEYVHRQIIRHF